MVRGARILLPVVLALAAAPATAVALEGGAQAGSAPAPPASAQDGGATAAPPAGGGGAIAPTAPAAAPPVAHAARARAHEAQDQGTASPQEPPVRVGVPQEELNQPAAQPATPSDGPAGVLASTGFAVAIAVAAGLLLLCAGTAIRGRRAPLSGRSRG